MINGIILVVIGVLAAAALVTKKVENSKELIEKLVPYQGIIGLVAFCWGVWGVISSILSLAWLAIAPLGWITYMAIAVVELLVGFLLGFGLISKYLLSKNEEAMKKGEEIREKLSPYQVTLGLICMGVGVWSIIGDIIFW